MEKINRGIYNIKINNEEEDIARLQNEMFKTVKLKEEAENANKIKDHLKKEFRGYFSSNKDPYSIHRIYFLRIYRIRRFMKAIKEILSYINIEVEAITSLVLTLLNISLIESETIEFRERRLF